MKRNVGQALDFVNEDEPLSHLDSSNYEVKVLEEMLEQCCCAWEGD